MNQACPLFLVFLGTSSTPLSPLSSARSRDHAPSSNRFRIVAYLDPRVGPQGTWGRDINDQHLPCSQGEGMNKHFLFTLYLPCEYK